MLSSLFPEGSVGQQIARSLEAGPAPTLLAGAPTQPDLVAKLAAADGDALFLPLTVTVHDLADGARSGLLLWADAFEESHSVAQGLENLSGSYLHGLCHRREGHRGAGFESNINNARYWFRRVLRHPVYPALYTSAVGILKQSNTDRAVLLESRGEWDPFLFIDWCESCELGDAAARPALEQIAAEEMRLLIGYCAQGALGVAA